MPGTDGVSTLQDPNTGRARTVCTVGGRIECYAFAMRSPVLSYAAVLRGRYEMPGTEMGRAATRRSLMTP
eukprot:1361230-Rhodomonas_salina.3